jgi:DNA-binding beta-propeller fold protein YncE
VFSAKPPFKMLAHYRLQPDPAKDGPDVGLYVRSKDRLYQSVDNVVDVIDPNTDKVLAAWKPGIQGGAKPIVYDHKTNHFILGSTDKKMLVLDGKDGSVIAEIPVQGAVDETVIDEAARRAYVGDKAGMIEVIDLDQNKIVDTIPSEKNVHTLAVDTKTHRVFVYRNESNKVDVFEFAPARKMSKS